MAFAGTLNATFVILGLLVILADSFYLSCDFDDDFCGYEPNQYFVRYTGKSPSISSGPVADHTTGEEGYYALCDARQLRDPSERCILRKEVMVTEKSELSFWYYMFGSQIGTLELVLDGETVWSLTGSQEKYWLRFLGLIGQGQHTIEFRASRSETGRASADLAIDDITIESEEITTRTTTATRTSPKPLTVSGCEFDVTTCGWQTDYIFNRWSQTNGNMSGYFDMLGPASDWTSLSSPVLNNQLQPLSYSCAIPYCIREENGDITTHHYCKRLFLRNRPGCGRDACPNTVDNSQVDICSLGYYLHVSNDKFNTPSASARSRLYSPVFQPKVGIKTYCLRYKYNIYTQHPDDGFSIFIDDYYNPRDILLTTKMGKLSIDRWHSESILLKNINQLTALRFVIQPFRQNPSLAVEDFASVSIDSIAFTENSCTDFDDDSSLVVDLAEAQTTTTTSTSTTTTTTATLPDTSTPVKQTSSTDGTTTIQTSPTDTDGQTPDSTTSEDSGPSPITVSSSETSNPTTTTTTTTTTPTRTTNTTTSRSTPSTTRSTTTLRTATLSVTATGVDNTVAPPPKKKGGNLYVNIFVPIASIVAFSLVVVGLYVLAKKKGYTFQSLKRNRSVDASNEDIPVANNKNNTNNMELGNH